MPLTPVSQASKLNKGNESVFAQMLSHRLYRKAVIPNQKFIVIVRGKAFSVSTLIPGSVSPGLFVQPLGNVHMRLVPWKITDKAQHQMPALASPSCQLVFPLDGFPIKNAFLWLKLCPGNVHIEKGNILADFQVPRTGRISHKRIAERFL